MKRKLLLLSTLGIVMVKMTYAKEVLPVVNQLTEEQVEEVTAEVQDAPIMPPVELEMEKPMKERGYVAGESIYNIYGRVGVDAYSEYDIIKEAGESINKKETDTVGYEVALEGTVEVIENVEVGLGIAYQKHGKSKSGSYSIIGVNDVVETMNTQVASFDSVPVYTVLKYNFPIDGTEIKPYLKANFGYSFNMKKGSSKADGVGTLETKISNGLYYGAGIGVEYQNFFLDAMYQINEAKAALKDTDIEMKKDYDYSRVTLGFGYKFNF